MPASTLIFRRLLRPSRRSDTHVTRLTFEKGYYGTFSQDSCSHYRHPEGRLQEELVSSWGSQSRFRLLPGEWLTFFLSAPCKGVIPLLVRLWHDTVAQLEEWAAEHDSAVVAYSGGKDSLCVMDLACKTFKQVVAFSMYFVPGLRVFDEQLEYAEKRWGIKIIQVPHFSLIQSLRQGRFCDLTEAHANLPSFELKDVYAWVLGMTGIDLLLTGAKNSDGLQRRQFFENVERQAEKGDVVWQSIGYPLKSWRKRDVISYLHTNKIPLPPSPEGVITSGIGLAPDIARWLKKDYPEDWEKICRWFPYAEAMNVRYDLYKVG